MKSFEQLAKAAYEAYCKEAVRVDEEGLAAHAYAWDELGPNDRKLWIAVAMKVAEEISAIH